VHTGPIHIFLDQ